MAPKSKPREPGRRGVFEVADLGRSSIYKNTTAHRKAATVLRSVHDERGRFICLEVVA